MEKKLREIRFNNFTPTTIIKFSAEEIYYFEIEEIKTKTFTRIPYKNSLKFKNLILILKNQEINSIEANKIYNMIKNNEIADIELIYENSPKETYCYSMFTDAVDSLNIEQVKEFTIISIGD